MSAAKQLHISPTIGLPLDAVTSTLVVYGGKGMGKTNFASVLVEEFDATGLRFAVIDPMGVWWGLRHDATGKGAGIEALILGGVHGDLPIEPTSGAVVADLVVDEDASVIIDISRRPDGSMWAIAERVRFVTDYAKRLYQRQGEKRRPIMQVIDEAARFAPQIVRAGDMDVAKCMGAIAVLVEEGRNVGIGVTLVTQRSARLNKDVAELADCMISFRIIGPNSMRAVLDWLGEHVDKARLKEIGEQLRSLPRGSALVVSPGWLEYEGIAAMRKRRTFDSSATPKPGHVVRASGAGAKPDIAKYRERLADVVERAKADDPKALRARIAELEKQLKARPASVETVTETVVKPVEVLTGSELATLKAAVSDAEEIEQRFEHIVDNLGSAIVDIKAAIELNGVPDFLERAATARLTPTARRDLAAEVRAAEGFNGHRKLERRHKGDGTQTWRPATAAKPAPVHPDAQKLEPRLVKLLAAIAWWDTIGIDTPSATMVAFLAGSSPNSSGFEKSRGQLRTLGLIEYPSGGTVRLTEEGARIAPRTSTPLTTQDLHDAVLQKLDPRHGRLLKPLIDAYPDALSDEELAKAAGQSASSSGFEKTRGQLRSWGLAEYPKPRLVRAADLLFPEGA